MRIRTGENGRRFNLFFVFGLIAISLANTWLVYTRSQVLSRECSGDRVVLVEAVKDKQESTFYELEQKQNALPATEGASYQITDCQHNPFHCWNAPLKIDHTKARVLGKPRKEKVFLTIGIPTIYRNHVNANYLSTTLHSLVKSIDQSEYKDVILVVFLADFNPKLRNQIQRRLHSAFKNHIENTGLIQVIEAPRTFYPPLGNLKRKFNDTLDRIYWRSKQSADYAFLLSYCKNLSEFYLQLEDDVVATSSYFKLMKEYVHTHPQMDWISISFSILGFIGKLFRTEDLDSMAKFILFFYDELPVDITYQYYLAMKGGATLKFMPSLFQHIGDISSLTNKIQPLKDPGFVESFQAKEKSDNPPAKFFTSMNIFEAYTPDLAYSRTQNFFWAHSPAAGDTLNIVFDQEQKLSRILVKSGMNSKPHDIIQNGMLQVCPAKSAGKSLMNIKQICQEHCFVTLGNFVNGKVDVNVVEKYGSAAIKCLRIVILQDQESWVLVRDFAVWVDKTSG